MLATASAHHNTDNCCGGHVNLCAPSGIRYTNTFTQLQFILPGVSLKAQDELSSSRLPICSLSIVVRDTRQPAHFSHFAVGAGLCFASLGCGGSVVTTNELGYFIRTPPSEHRNEVLE